PVVAIPVFSAAVVATALRATWAVAPLPRPSPPSLRVATDIGPPGGRFRSRLGRGGVPAPVVTAAVAASAAIGGPVVAPLARPSPPPLRVATDIGPPGGRFRSRLGRGGVPAAVAPRRLPPGCGT